MVNKIAKWLIFTGLFIVVVSVAWQAKRTACFPVEMYPLCHLRSYFYWRWIYDYQTLITGLLALAGAWWAASAVYGQIRQAEVAEQARLDSKRAAARAVLPITLSAICDYAEDCVHLLQHLLEKCDDERLPDEVKIERLPSIPNDAFGAMKEMVEAAWPNERDTLATLLETIQIQRSRIAIVSHARRARGQAVLAINLEGFIVDAAEVYARAASLFLFSRRLTRDVPSATITAQKVESALHNLGIFDHDAIFEAVGRRFD